MFVTQNINKFPPILDSSFYFIKQNIHQTQHINKLKNFIVILLSRTFGLVDWLEPSDPIKKCQSGPIVRRLWGRLLRGQLR